MTTEEEMLREWLIALSDMIGGDLSPASELPDALAWFGELGEDTLGQVQGLGRDNPSIQEFLDLGPVLMKQVEE